MNRNEEWMDLIKELDETVPEMGGAIAKASRRKARKNFLYQPLAGITCLFAAFVLSVNLCAPIAEACSKIPVLRDLVKAVTFSKSLSTAVENEYVQEMNLKQTKGDVTVVIDYLIVDQKQVNVFYHFESKRYEKLIARCGVLDENKEKMSEYSMVGGDYGLENEELHCASINFYKVDVPDKLCFQMDVREFKEGIGENSLEQFDFFLEYDPTFTAKGTVYPVNQSFVIDGQTLIVTEMEVYPTHMRVNVKDIPENTAWFQDLTFYIETEAGERFSSTMHGVSAFGSSQEGDVVSYYAESPYFFEAEHLKLVVTGVAWLEKGMEETWVDLKTGETGPLPEGTTLKEIKKDESGEILLVFEQTHIGGDTHWASLGHFGYDAEGNLYSFATMTDVVTKLEEGEEGTVFESYALEDFPDEKVWVKPAFSRRYRLEEHVTVELK